MSDFAFFKVVGYIQRFGLRKPRRPSGEREYTGKKGEKHKDSNKQTTPTAATTIATISASSAAPN